MKKLTLFALSLCLGSAAHAAGAVAEGRPLAAEVASVLKGFTLESPNTLAVSLNALRQPAADPAQKFVLELLSEGPEAVKANLELHDFPEATSQKVMALARSIETQASADPALAQALETTRVARVNSLIKSAEAWKTTIPGNPGPTAARMDSGLGRAEAPELPANLGGMAEAGFRPTGPRPSAPFALRKPLPDPGNASFLGSLFKKALLRPVNPVSSEIARAMSLVPAGGYIHGWTYDFDLEDVTEALLAAHERGVEIQLLADYGHFFPERPNGPAPVVSPQYQKLMDLGLVRIVHMSGPISIMHEKVWDLHAPGVENGDMIEFGSYNYSLNSEDFHFEHAFFADDARRIASFRRDWAYTYDLSKSYEEAKSLDWNAFKPGPAPEDSDKPINFNGVELPLQAFSPNGGVRAYRLATIAAARSIIKMAMFGYYSIAEAKALVAAMQRGVAFRAVFDRGQTGNPLAQKLIAYLTYYGADLKLLMGPDPNGDARKQKVHIKTTTYDGQLVAAGSYNLSNNAEQHNKEDENWFDVTEQPVVDFIEATLDEIYAYAVEVPAKPAAPPVFTAEEMGLPAGMPPVNVN